ncbi:MAG: hypothetical protein RMI49_03545 [Candidatus Caldarchaeum sp.]|nr:hypothetical protein [Candidatus Caldarchaeum sp.]
MTDREIEDARGWRNAFLLLFLVAASLLLLDWGLGFQLTPVFLFFSVYLPLAFAGVVFFIKYVRRIRKY